MENKSNVQTLKKDIEELGYFVDFGTSNPEKDQIQQLHVYKDKDSNQPIAKVSLILACRVNTMFNGVGKKQKELLRLLVNFSTSL